jgi:hypothetical protein
MKICLIGNVSDRRCGFANVSLQTDTALRRAGHDVTLYDGTYSAVYARQQVGPITAFFPLDIESFDVVHLIWNAMTMNHYNGADWAALQHPIISWWDGGGPSDAYCPFAEWMQVRWSAYTRDGYHQLAYPVPDWVEPLPIAPDPGFVVGASSVRGDGIAELQQICEQEGWAMNLPTPGAWLSLDDEIRRLARSTVNVCWYRTPPLWKDRASAPSMLLASTRPLLVNEDDLLAHLWEAQDIYHGRWGHLREALQEVHRDWQDHVIKRPDHTYRQLMWKVAAKTMADVWEGARG